jgi:predicted O-linked N-acetylglucosamine transferase (SPINDLY family)
MAIADDENDLLQQAFASFQSGRLLEAKELGYGILVINPNHAEALNLLGLIAFKLGLQEKAIEFYIQAIDSNPHRPIFYSNLACAYMSIGMSREGIDSFRRGLLLDPSVHIIHSNLLFALHYSPESTLTDIFVEHFLWGIRHTNQKISQVATKLDLERPLRIGYLSPDFRDHSVAYFIEPILEAHRRSEVEVFCYSNVSDPDATTQRLEKLAAHWHTISCLSDEEVCAQIRSDQIDILVDLAGHTDRNRLTVFAYKPAPIQITYLGYPNTTGISQIDYRLTDAWADPTDEVSLHTETLIRLESGFLCYRPAPDAPPVSPPPVLVSQQITFGCFNTLTKINPAVLEVWATILTQVPTARLLLKAGQLASTETQKKFADIFTGHGIAPERILFSPHLQEKNAHLHLYRQVDIALDPFPYNGTTTTCEAIWMGVPVIALAGNSHASRVGVSLLSQLGLEELIATSKSEYVQKAVELAQDLDRLINFRESIRLWMAVHSLCDGEQFTRNLENVYRQIWQARHQSVQQEQRLLPASIAAMLSAEQYFSIACTLHEVGRLEEALELYKKTIDLRPDFASAYSNLGGLLRQLKQPQEAKIALSQAIKLQSDLIEAHLNLGCLYHETEALEAAEFHYRKVLEVDPNFAELHFNLALIYRSRGQTTEAITCCRRTLEIEPNHVNAHSHLLLCLHYDPMQSPQQISLAHKEWADHHGCFPTMCSSYRAWEERPLRIGYISANLHTHSVAYFIEPLLTHHSKAVETFCYSQGRKVDKTTKRLQQAVCYWRDISQLNDQQVAELIHSENIDILVDLGGHTSHNRLQVFARKPAPVQLTYLGYPNSTGLPQIDYRLVDLWTDPVTMDNLCSEKLIRLEGGFLCYHPPEDAPEIAPLPHLKNPGITFGSFNALAKLNSQVIALWAKLLKAIPNSRLLLKSAPLSEQATCERFYQLFEQHGITQEQLIFSTWEQETRSHLELYNTIDIALDPFPYNGTTTTCEALWMGVPVITLEGNSHVSRVGTSLLSTLQLERLIAHSEQEYLEIALQLAQDRQSLKILRSTMRARMLNSSLCNGEDFAYKVEDAYKRIWLEFCNQGNALTSIQKDWQSGKTREAEKEVRIFIQSNPKNAQAWHLLSIFLQQRGIYEEALSASKQAISIEPLNVIFLNSLGTLCASAGNFKAAIENYNTALTHRSDLPELHLNLGLALHELKSHGKAISAFRKAISLRPELPEAHTSLGTVFAELKDYEEAISCFQRAIDLVPLDPQIHFNLAISLQQVDRKEEAISHYRTAIKYQPHHAEAHSRLGGLLQEQGKYQEAVTHCLTALSLREDAPAAFYLGNCLLLQGKGELALEGYQKALEFDPKMHQAFSNYLFASHCTLALSPKEIANKHRIWAEQYTASLQAASLFTNLPIPNRRLKIGYVSPDFFCHSVSNFFEPLLEAHDRSTIEVFCYAEVEQPDSTTVRLQKLADHWCFTCQLSDEELATRIHNDQIDILVDLAGHTVNNRLLVFARRPAPVQVSYLGYPNTTGLSQIDYKLTDALVDPLEVEELYSETLVRLPQGFLCYRPISESPDILSPPCLQNGCVTFGSFNSLQKLNSETIQCWAKILTEIPGSRLLLKATALSDQPTLEDIQQRFLKAGIATERLLLTGRIPARSAHIGFYSQIDIALDPFPYNGTTTTCEALWMGVPVITLEGDSHVSRVGISLLSQLGLEELIAKSKEAYIETAIYISKNIDYLVNLRSQLRQQMAASPLCDGSSFALRVEDAYRWMWEQYCQKSFTLLGESEDGWQLNNLGYASKLQGDLPHALACFEKAITYLPEEFLPHWNYATTLLLAGDYKRGFAEFEWRLFGPDYPLPESLKEAWFQFWDGTTDLADSTLLVYADQGLGDAIQFIRYLPLIAEKVGRLVLGCHPSLHSLFACLDGIDLFVGKVSEIPEFDAWIPLMSLPCLFDTDETSIPTTTPYLETSLKKSIPDSGRLKVGFVWAAGIHQGTELQKESYQMRSCSLENFATLLEQIPIALYSLQLEDEIKALSSLPSQEHLYDLSGQICNFADTAALINELDLVISVDTAVAHLAGALGKPTWVLLPFTPDWRWQLERTDSAWYPTMRLFRQGHFGDWHSVFAEVKAALLELSVEGYSTYLLSVNTLG